MVRKNLKGRLGKFYLVFLFLCFVVSSCEKNDLNTEEALKHQVLINTEPSYPLIPLDELCPNELALLVNPKNNWEIDLDSIKTMDEFIKARSNKRVEYYMTKEGRAQLDSIHTYYEITIDSYKIHPRIFPFVTIQGHQISLAQVLIPSGGGFLAPANETMGAFFFSQKQLFQDLIPQKIELFFNNYDRRKSWRPKGTNLKGPILYVFVNEGSFHLIDQAIEVICNAYLNGINLRTNDHLGKDICDLTESELAEIKKNHPLKIYLTKQM